MATIYIENDALHTPEAVIQNCWNDRASGLLSREAGVALMPYINEQERTDAEYERVIQTYEYGNPALPPRPDALHTYFIDGKQAFPAKEVTREQHSLYFAGDGTPTGRVYMHTQTDLLKLMDDAM